MRFASVMREYPVERFNALNAISICRHLFIKRIPGINVSHDKTEALTRLDAIHTSIREASGFEDWPLVTAEQIHGADIAVIDAPIESRRHFHGCDGFITNQRGLALGIHVADCCAIYIVDPKKAAIGLIHSGRKGTECNIVGNAIKHLSRSFGSNPADLIVQLSPCIRPPHYETDFAAQIVGQCRAAGLEHINDSGVCTACHPDRYYSYRLEKGKTGRMLALLGLNP